MLRLRIACVTLEYPPDTGGVATYLAGLLGAIDADVQIIRPVFRSVWPRWWPVIKLFKHAECDVALVSHLLPIGTAAWIAKRFFGGSAYILSVHGLDVLHADRSLIKRWLAHQVLKNAYVVVANSEYTAKLVRERVEVCPVVITPGYVPRSFLTRIEARQKLGIDLQKKIVLAVARLVPRKGFDILIQAMMDVHAQLVMIGRGPDEERLQGIIHEQKSTAQLLTNVSNEARDLWYAAADVFALPVREEAQDVEGFGIVYLEAAAAGLPVVAGRSGGAAEAIEEGVTGVLVDSRSVQDVKEKIQYLLEHATRAQTMGVAGQRRVLTKFDWSTRTKTLETALPLISVIIPVYDRMRAFEVCLTSLTKQTYRRFEVIIVDDGSVEPVADVVERFRVRLPLQYIRQDNQGAPAARNRGFAASMGMQVIFLDADAKLVPSALEKMVQTLALHPEADVAYSAFHFGWKRFASRTFDAQVLRSGNFIHTSALMRRKVFPGFDVSLKRFQDWDLWLTIAKTGSQMISIPSPLFRLQAKGTMSAWMPAFLHRLPWHKWGWQPKRLQSYQDAEQVVRRKHGLL